MESILIENGLVWTGGDSPRMFEGEILVAGGRIQALGPKGSLPRDSAIVIDAGGRLVTPGFINAHMHLYSALARGISLKGEPAANFSEILEKLWWKLDAALSLEDIAAGAELMLLEGLRAGVTTVIDHHASYGAIYESLKTLAESARHIGVRFSTCFEVSDRHGEKKAQQAIEENLRFYRFCRGRKDLVATFGLHASFTLSARTLEKCRKVMEENDLSAHVHLAEDRADNEHASKEGFSSACERLVRAGVLRPQSLAIHGVHTTENDWELLRENEIFLVHNPQSNMNNAVGAAQVEKMLASGLVVGLGTDGMEADVREEIRAAYLLGRHRLADPRTMWAEAGRLFDNNRRIASALFKERLGELCPQAPADVVIFDYVPPTPISESNFLGHLIFGFGRLNAWCVLVDGRIRLSAGQPVDVDPARIAARALKCAQALWKRL